MGHSHTPRARTALVGASPNTVAALVADNIYRLRTERGWSQVQLAARLHQQGLRYYAAAQIAQIELGTARADHVLEMAAFCQAFGVPMTELLAGPLDVPIKTAKAAVPLETIRMALSSGVTATGDVATTPDLPDMSIFFGISIAEKLGIGAADLDVLTYEMYGYWEFIHERDRRAGLDPFHWSKHHAGQQAEPRAQGKRGHATRVMLAEMKAYLAEHPMAEIWERHHDAWQARQAEAEMSARDEVAYQWHAQTGEWPTKEELDEYMAADEAADTDKEN